MSSGKGDSPRPMDRQRYNKTFSEIKWNDKCASNCKGCPFGVRYTQEARVEGVSVEITKEPEPLCKRKKGKQDDSD